MNYSKVYRLRLLACAATAIALTAPVAAHAQTPAQDQTDTAVSEVVATASRIRGVASTGSDVIALDTQDIAEAGTSTTSDLLRKVPQIVGLGPSATAASAQNGAANTTRGSGVNLRGIGVNSTLLLLDGRRLPPAGTQGQFTDPSVIPAIALQRVEVIADGASALYGSDAVTGVVNLILRRNFDGLEVRGRYGYADGYEEGQASLLFGKSWDGGNLLIAYDHLQNSVLSGNERDFYTSDLRAQGGQDLRSNFCTPGNIVVGATRYAIPATGVTAATAGALTAGTINKCDLYKYNSIIPEMSRDNVVASVRHDITGNITLFAQGFFGHRDFTLYGNGANPGFAQQVTIPNTNPYFASPIPGATSVNVEFNFIPETGVNRNAGFGESYQWVGGADVKLWGDWRGQVSYSSGRSHDEVNRRNEVNAAALAAAAASTNPATALNPFGSGANNPATLAGIRIGQTRIHGGTQLNAAELRADGGLFDLPGGKVRAAVGYEYRKEGLATDTYGGTAATPTLIHSAVKRNSNSIYAEVYVPIVGEGNARPGIESINLSLAGRYEDYSDFGSTSNPKVGLTWAITPNLKLRGSYGTSFRAPSPVEYDTIGGGAGLYGETLTGPGGPRYGISIAGGNAGLKPEEATTYSAGFEYRPKFADGLTVSLNYFDINYSNQIISLRGTPGLLTLPVYARFVNLSPTPAEITAIQAQGLPVQVAITSPVTFIADGRRQNLGSTLAQGFDYSVFYRTGTSLGDLEIGASGTYFTNFETSIAQGAALTDNRSVIGNPQRHRNQASASLQQGPWNSRVAWNFTSFYRNNTVTPVQRVKAYNTVDLHIDYDLSALSDGWLLKKTSLALDVLNVTDQQPPYVNIISGYDPQSANPLGRFVALSLSKAF